MRWITFCERQVDHLGTAIIVLEAIVFEFPALLWWPVIWGVKLFSRGSLSLHEAGDVVCRYGARVLCWPAVAIAEKYINPETAETTVVLFGTSIIFWGVLFWFIL